MNKENCLFDCIGDVLWEGEVEEILLNDKKFVEDLDNFPGLLMGQKFADKPAEELKEFLHQGVIGNTARTFILDVLALDHLSRILKQESKDFLDFYWKPRLDEFLTNKAENSDKREEL